MKGIEQCETPWPPSDVLDLVGLTREEWDKMSNDIEGNQSSRYPVILGMLMKAYRRRIKESKYGKEMGDSAQTIR